MQVWGFFVAALTISTGIFDLNLARIVIEKMWYESIILTKETGFFLITSACFAVLLKIVIKQTKEESEEMALEEIEGTRDEIAFKRFLHLQECKECQKKFSSNPYDLKNPTHEIDSCQKNSRKKKK